MKAKYLFFGAIFVISGLVARSQVYQMYYQGFETDETQNYTVTPSSGSTFSTDLRHGGARSIKLVQSTTEDIVYVTDTIDFRSNTTLRYVALEFDHICNVNTNGGINTNIGLIYVKRALQADEDYTQLTGMSHWEGNHNLPFFTTASFNKYSYPEWQQTTMTNDYWKHERFNINTMLDGVPTSERMLIFKFVLKRKTTSGAANGSGWWLDNINIRSSQNQIKPPVITMVTYPDGGLLPSSRGARVELAASTVLTQGIDPDSVYLIYKVGSDPTEHRLYMTARTETSPVYQTRQIYSTRIPFEGYDTLMHFYCVVKDASTNANTATFPESEGSWVTYRCIRGTARDYLPIAPGFTYTSGYQYMPFPIFADNRSEFVYDSTLLANAGYGPGAITDVRFILAGNTSSSQRSKFQLRLKNAETNYTVLEGNTNPPFTNDYMQVVFDSTLFIAEGAAGAERHIHLKDTFFYAGKDIVAQVIYDNNSDVAAANVGMIPCAANKKSIFFFGMEAEFNTSAYTNDDMQDHGTDYETRRPVFLFTEHANQPLLYDVGISALLNPNYTTPITNQSAQLSVQLKNFGANTVNAVRISYSIDDTISGYYDWTGSLAGQATTPVVIATNVSLPAGYHTLCAWVEDTLTASNAQYRDHEPYNDTSCSEFIVCDGPLSGVRNIGGPNPDYNNIEEFLFSLSRCGIDDSLVVRLAPGNYPPFTMPVVDGITNQHYIVFCPQGSGNVTIYKDATTSATSIVDLQNVSNIRFRDINFVRRSGTLSNMVGLGMTSDNCRFNRCSFIDSMPNVTASTRIGALLSMGFSNGLRVDGCTFVGGAVAMDLAGQANDTRSSHIFVTNNVCYNQNTNAIKLQFLSNVTVKGNELYDVTDNASYVLLVYRCNDTVNILANKLYTSHGAGAIGVSNVTGTNALPVLVANNMIVCHDDGNSNLLTTPLNIIDGEWIDVIYNSVKMTATSRNNIATATFGGGTGLSNSRFVNNIVACFDDVNYAFNYLPGNTSVSNTINHNVYYSEGYTLNRRTPGGNYTNLAGWQAAIPGDSNSISINPGFINGSLVDLRTFNRLIKGVGTPIASVTTDMFDTVRNATAPCPGAFEFVSLYYDFEPEALTNPLADNCDMPQSTELVVRMRNSGVTPYSPGGSVSLSMAYQIGNGAIHTFTVNSPVPADDTVSIHTGQMLSLPPNGTRDSVYVIKVWVISSSDPNQTNDTNIFNVISRFHEQAPTNINLNVPYATRATIVPTQGFTQWNLYNSTSPLAPKKRGNVHWYRSLYDDEPFFKGDTLVTDTLRQDTIIYFKQRREAPVVRITQVQVKGNNAVGLTNPMPTWMASGTKLAVQLTNVGDDTAYLQGDTLRTVSTNSSYNGKIMKFGDVRIAPGQSLVVQYVGGTATNPHTVHSGSAVSPAITTPLGIVYRHGGRVVDAVALNGVSLANSTNWTGQNVPVYVWADTASVRVSSANATCGGIIRTAFNGNVSDWTLASDANRMFLDTNRAEWMRYVDNGCPGDFAQVAITMSAPPTADISLTAIDLPSGCNLGMENVSVHVRNYGTQPVNNLVLNYNAGGATVSETLTTPVVAGGDFVYTFQQQLNMATAVDSNFNVVIWATAVSGDTYNVNDTCTVSALALYTPAAPMLPAVDTIQYATADTITLSPLPRLIPVWYDNNMNPVDTGYTHITNVLYTDETVSAAYIVADSAGGQIGNAATMNTKNAFPSPYQPYNKFVKQQYIYSAAELRSIGLQPGTITNIAFHLDSIWGTVDSLVYNNYYISMGLTTDTTYASTSAWKSTQVVFSRVPYVLYRSSSHQWVNHSLDTPFMWDGTSSIAVQIVYERDAAYTTGLQTTYTTKANTTLHKAGNSALASNTATMDFVGAGTRGNNRPNIKFNSVTLGCISSTSTMNIHLVGVPDADAKLYWPDGSDTLVYNSCGNVEMYVNVRNLGLSTLNGFKLRYFIDNQPEDSTIVATTLVPGAITQPQLFSKPLVPGRHTVLAIVNAEGDSINGNDTVSCNFMVRFCGGTYTIDDDMPADFSTFGEAIDTLNIVGIDGPVVFYVGAGVYNEQLTIGEVAGASAVNTLTFRGVSDTAVLLTASTSQNLNYVMQFDGASHVVIDSISIVARPTTASVTYANALVLQNVSDFTLQNSTVRVKGTINNANASCVVLQSNVSNLTMINNTIDSGYYSVKSVDTVTTYSNLVFQNNRFTNFWFGGLELKNVVNFDLSSNQIRSGVNIANRGLTGVKLTAVDSVIMIQKNHIYLVDDKNGGKQGIRLERVKGFNQVRAYIMNNMISCAGTGAAGGVSNPAGIYIDKGCSYINIYYNSIRVYAGATQANSRGIHIGGNNIANITNLQVMNNIFANYSNAYAYYVSGTNMVNSSDYNAYFTQGQKLAFWGADCLTLPDLQAANTRDANSLFEEPYYVSENDLHLIMTNFVSKAQYNTDVVEDIDGTTRPQIPAPTIGAHEMERLSHNMSVVRILTPVMPASINNPNNVESDSILVKVEFYNNGSATESNVQWYAYLEGHENVTTSVTRNLGNFLSGQKKVDSVMVPTVLGIIDTQTVRVVLLVGVDDDTTDNQMTAPVYLGPAYDLQAQKIQTGATGCDLRQTSVSITLKNVGFKDFPAGASFQIGFHAQAYPINGYQAAHPENNQLSIPTMPDTVIETHVFTSILPTGQPVTITFDSLANFYPTDTTLNLKVRINGWCRYFYDVAMTNDTTAAAASASPVIESYYTPASPVGRDTTFAYGTWGEVKASQIIQRPIMWFRDTNSTHFYTNNSYAASCKWSTTPQYFHDSTYYLMCKSDKGCSSFFSPVHVFVAPRLPVDAAIETVIAPLGGRVYTENDTVRVRLANYGTQAISNIPVSFALRKGNNTNPIQTATQICTATIDPGTTYVFTFDTLLLFNTPLVGGNYQLRVWTDLENDGERRNDTIRMLQELRPAANNNTRLDYNFSTLSESTYPAGVPGASSAMDFTRISFNEIDIDLPPLGRAYTNFGAFNNPEWPVLRLTRGTKDSIILAIAVPGDPGSRERGKVAVYIDFNRNGSFNDIGEDVLHSTTLFTNVDLASEISIPPRASFGYMRMRVVVSNYEFEPTPETTGEQGHMVDFLIFVNAQAPISDLALTQIYSPRDYLIRDDDSVAVAFRMANKGRSTINSVTIHYRFDADTIDSTATGSFQWVGNLAPGRSEIVSLPRHGFPYGTSELTIWHSFNGDVIHRNDTLKHEYHRFHTIVLTMEDNFDSLNYWYAPKGYNEFTRNFWQLGTPHKSNITMAYSEPNAWVTDTNFVVTSGRRGNISYLYSPIIDIAQIRPDTISMRLLRNLINGSYLQVEFYNYERNWQKLDVDTLDYVVWYNDVDEHVFNGTSTGNAYNRYWVNSSFLSNDYNEKLQFRFVYVTPQGSSDNSSYGEGCAIDEFKIGRARRRVDVGVIDITQPEFPKYGQTLYPEVVVKNYGLDTVRHFQLGYTTYNAVLERISEIDCLIPPGETDTFAAASPFIVTSDFPDTFSIQAFSYISSDIYRDNDTNEKSFALAPLDNDISAEAILQPLDRVVAGDSVTVTMRIRNFGVSEITNARLSYIFNGYLHVTEDVDIEAILGRPLQSMEFFNYTFHQRFRASMGIMNLSCIAKNDNNEYIYNDTVFKRFNGIAAITDIAAAAVVIDTSQFDSVRVQLIIENRGARGANNFEVGFWYDNDTSTLITEYYRHEAPLEALATGYHVFRRRIPDRPAPYDHVVGYVHIDDDNDPSNDTTTAIDRLYIDIEVMGIVIEENANPDCRVFLQMRNIGDFTLSGKTLQMRATINGNDLSTSIVHTLEPGRIVTLEFNRRIPKDRMRHYVGNGRLAGLASDIDQSNNQTTHITVVNYFEGVPTVNGSQFVLDQNYPNPFSGHTVVPFSLPEAANVHFFVMDAMGKIVNNFERFFPAGDNTIELDMHPYSAGVYYYGIEVDGQRQMRKMILK